MVDNRKNILFLIQLPPPVHGSSIMNKIVFENPKLNDYKKKIIHLDYSKKISDIGGISIRKIITFIKHFYSFLNLILLKKIDLIYLSIAPVGFALFRDLIFILIGNLFNKKIVLHFHGKGISIYENTVLGYFIKKIIYNSYIILLSKNLLKDVSYFIKDETKLYIIPNGINTATLNNLHKQRVNGNILFLSNLLFSKGILDFLKSLKVLKESGKIFSARIIGDETSDLSSKELNQFICDYGLEHCVGYFGAKFNEEKEMEFIKSSIFVFPTQNETFGLVNLEAMKYSLPIVSTNEGAIPDIISDNESGFLVGKGNYLELSDKIGFLLDNPKVASKMGIAGNKILQEKFTKVIFEEKIKNMFDDILCAE